MTTYDEIWQAFLNNCKVSDIELPNSDDKRYEYIRNALMYFNNRMRTKYVGDDIGESLNDQLSEDHLLILANYIRLIFLINQKTFYENTWQPFASDIGVKYFGTQLKSLETSVNTQNATIDRLIMYTEEDFL